MVLILHIDDEPMFLELIKVVLKEHGHQIMSAANSNEAFHLLQKEPIDLFIQDLNRTPMNGRVTYQIMKVDPEMRRIPVLITTGNLESWPTIADDIGMYNDEYLEKPYDLKEFVIAVDRLLAKSPSPT